MSHKEVENMLGIICFLFFITKSIKTETVNLSPSPTVDVTANSPLNLTCTTTYTMKFVFLLDSTLVGDSAITLYAHNGDCLKFTGNDGYTYTCSSVSGPYEFTISSVTRQYHNSIITCKIQYGESSTVDIASATTQILVNVPLVINYLTPDGTLTKNLTDTQLFKCSASGFPKATITWDVDGSTASTMAPPTTSDSGETVTSEIIYTPQKTDNGKRITCTASNRIDSASLSTELVIQYLPTVEVSPSNNPYNVIENTTDVILKCTVKEANPDVISYRWYHNGFIVSRNSTYVIQQVLIVHGGKYTCDASNKVGSSKKPPALVMNVLYGVKLKIIDKQQPNEGSSLSITCTGESNPAIQDSYVTWTKQNNQTFNQTGMQLTLNTINRKDSGYYICTVVIPLISSNGPQVNVTAKTSVHVDVFYPPDVELSPNYTQYDVIENTTNLQLKCIIKESNPIVTSYRWYHNGSFISSTSAIYVIPKVSRSAGGKFTCEATNTAGLSTKASEMVLNVLFGVKVDTINTQERLEGGSLTINCSGKSNPVFQDNDVTWTKQNNMTFTQPGKKLVIDKVDRMDSGSFICTIVLTLTPSDGQPLDTSGTTNFQLHVLYQPVVEIIPSFQPYNIIENTTNIHLNCKVKEAYPAVKSYLWNKDGTNMSTHSSFEIPFVQKSNSGNYTCYGINKAGRSRPSSSLIVNVLYGVKVDTIGLQQPVEGSKFSVFCTGISNPPIEENEIVWTKKNNNTFEQLGKQLLINDISRVDNGSFICTVKKSLTPSVGNIDIVTGTTTVIVDVLYRPMVEIVTNRNVIIQENSTDLVLTCFVKEANPEVKEYTWYKDGSVISQERNEKYKLKKVYRADAGYYTCSGSNYVGSTNSTNLEVNVLYGVTLNLSRSRITVNESEQLSIVCAAVGNPLPTLSWINIYNNSVIIETDKVDTNSLTVNNANCIDTGVYTCVGNNSIGSVAFYSIAVNVKCQPRTLDNRDMRTIIVNGIGGVLSISEVFISYPSSDVHWLKQTQDDNNTVLDNQFDRFDNKSIIPFGTISTLYKEEMTREEFGTYIAIAVNNYGSYEVKYNVIPKGKPYPPTNVSAICGITSITVSWISKFNGGDNQTFRIYFHNEDRNITTMSSGDKPDEGEGSYMKQREESFIPNSFYKINVEAKNYFGYTNSTEIVTCSTAKLNEKESTSLALTGGIAGTISSLLVVSVVVIVIFIIRRRKNLGVDKKTVKRCNQYTDEDEDGLKDNPLYGTSEQPANYGGGLINGSENINTDTEPIVIGLEEGPVYSKVEKIGQKGKQKKHEKKLKNGNHGQLNKDIEMGTVYENSDKLSKVKAKEEVYENAPTDNERVQPNYTTDQCKSRKNKDGLVYADLDLAPHPNGKRFVIRGLENRNNYAIIDLSKTAEPLPPDSDEEDTAKTNTITKEDN